MGLLDSLEDPRMALAMSLLSSAGPSARPIGIGQALGMGMNEMQQQRMLNDRRKQMEMHTQMQQMQMDQLKKQLAKQQQIDALAKNSVMSPQSQAIGAFGPTPQGEAAIGQLKPNFDIEGFLSGMMGVDPVAGLEMRSKFAKSNKLKEIKNFSIGGKVAPVAIYEDGTYKTMDGLDVPPEIIMQNLGNRVVAVDKNSLRGGENMNLGVSPDTVYSGGITMRGQNMTDARAKEANAAPQFDSATGSWLYKPTQANPTGGAVPVPGLDKQKPLTADQGTSALFGNRAAKAHSILGDMASVDVEQPGYIKRIAENTPLIGESMGTLTNWTQSAGQQKVEQAQRDFINAILRRESGAVISPQEFDNARKQYFPQPGDSDEVKKQKAENRETAINGLAVMAGPAGTFGVQDAAAAARAEMKRRGLK